jgi:hypothetical protein
MCLRQHAQLGILLNQIGLCLLKLFKHRLLEFGESPIIGVVLFEIGEKCILCVLVSTQKQGYTKQNTLFQEDIIIKVSDVLA